MTNPTCRTCRHRTPGEPLRCAHPTEPVDEFAAALRAVEKEREALETLLERGRLER